MKIKFIAISFFIAICFAGFIVVNLGKFLDVTQKPSSSDVIICFSDSKDSRAKKALELYEKGYSKSHKIIFTTSHVKKTKGVEASSCIDNIASLKNGDIPPQNIVCIYNIENTMQELQGVRDYLLMHHMKSAMIVSDAPHSRRIVFLADRVVKFNALDLRIIIVGSDAPWWNSDYYYMNRLAIGFVVLEMAKLPYNYIKYGILYDLFSKYGLLDTARKYAAPSIKYLKNLFGKYIYQ